MPDLLTRLGLGRRDLRAWAMYDWANSAFQTTIIAAIFPIIETTLKGQSLQDWNHKREADAQANLRTHEAEADKLANQIFGMNLVTHQTGPEGRKVSRLLVEQGLPIARELL